MNSLAIGALSTLPFEPANDTSNTTSVRILLVDDFAPLRSFFSLLLSEKPELQVVGQALDGSDAVQKAAELKPDLVVLDIGLPKLNGIEVARQIRSSLPNCKILFLTSSEDLELARTAFETGAEGYVVKLDAGGELLAAVEALLLGKRYVSKKLAGCGLGEP
jgi:DNA-binding NarL/FixJ family response regulator